MPIPAKPMRAFIMISRMTFGEPKASAIALIFSQSLGFGIFLLGWFWMPFCALSQAEPSVQLRENYERNQTFQATIGGDSIEMHLVFDGIINPKSASIYAWFGAVSGYYNWAGSVRTSSVKGVLWHPDSLSLYVPDIADGQSCWLEVTQSDSVVFWDSENIGIPVPVLQVFSLQATSGSWKKGNALEPVEGIDFSARGLERTVVLEVMNEKGVVQDVDVSELICQHVGLSHQEWIGYSGWAEAFVSLLEFTFIEGGINVLLSVEVSGSCNTDRSYLLSFQLDVEGRVGKAQLFQIGNCLFYGAEKSSDQSFKIVLYDPPLEGVKVSEGCIGAFQIIQSEVIVQKDWSGTSSRSSRPDGGM